MKRSIPLKLKLTTISVCILTVMCVAFAISTIYSTNGLVQATITTPAISVDESMPAITSEPSVAVTEALWQFRGTTVLGYVLSYCDRFCFNLSVCFQNT